MPPEPWPCHINIPFFIYPYTYTYTCTCPSEYACINLLCRIRIHILKDLFCCVHMCTFTLPYTHTYNYNMHKHITQSRPVIDSFWRSFLNPRDLIQGCFSLSLIRHNKSAKHGLAISWFSVNKHSQIVNFVLGVSHISAFCMFLNATKRKYGYHIYSSVDNEFYFNLNERKKDQIR